MSKALYLLLFPGVILHEFSHYIACLLVGVKVHKAKFFSFEEAYVKHSMPGLWESLFITISPFFFCNLLGIIFFIEAKNLMNYYFLISVVYYWISLSSIYFSFPSDQDAHNSLQILLDFIKKKVLIGKIFNRIFWLLISPFFVLPIMIILAIILFFNYFSFLRLFWLIFVVVAVS
ncbi:MAG: M50 family metallopeptidase [Candidatus Diapherotrites archaeon]|nr:M50 family metallopeptidase [Candidatus Diapherotrites archaeon]